MHTSDASQAPPFCPNPACRFHRSPGPEWRFIRAGFHPRSSPPHRVQRYHCRHCGRHFSDQTFRPTYWLRRPDLLEPIFHRLLGCSAYRQIAREHEVSPQTVLGQAARLGRHCLLFHELQRPRAQVVEPLVLDGFESFEYSQYHPTRYHVVAGQASHFFYGFTDSELRRSGRMTARQKRRRAVLEARHGRPDPRSTETEVARLIALLTPTPQALVLCTDEHHDYPRAIARLAHLRVVHRTVSSRATRTPRNPLFAINLLDLLIRHSGANHKRETIAFSKRRQSAVERLWVLLVWRNYIKSFSERKRGPTPAMRLGLLERRLTPREVLKQRLFVTRLSPPEPWLDYYWRRIQTRAIPNCREHRPVLAT
jgi:transposase-like protein